MFYVTSEINGFMFDQSFDDEKEAISLADRNVLNLKCSSVVLSTDDGPQFKWERVPNA